MSQSFEVAFEPSIFDRVAFAIAPFDAFTGDIVRRGVEASVDGLPDKPVSNRSGLLVFVNLPVRPHYDYRLSAAKAGYFDPDAQPLRFHPATDPKRQQIALLRRPERAYPDTTTLIRGVVFRAGAPVVGATIILDPLGGATTAFETRSGAGGGFVLPLRLPELAHIEADAKVQVKLNVGDAQGSQQFTGEVGGGRPHRFSGPLDLANAQNCTLEEM